MSILRSIFGFAVGAAAPPEVSGKALMKQTAKQYGVDIGRIPENAWDEMVKNCISQAKVMSNLPGTESFPTYLVSAVEGTANLIVEALKPDSRSPLAEGWVREILKKHGVLKN